ncbi:MAG: GntR family transcriptional regulator [Lysobacterales bacterium]|jgi:DNA-binding GntR family transcriptional regulator
MSDPPPIAVTQPSLAQQAHELLEQRLVTLQLAPGALISEKELVERLGIGRTPVREAIQRLSAAGMLQVLPRKGLLVAPMRRSELLQVIEVRRVLERLMVVKATERATAQQRRALGRLAARLEAAQSDLNDFFRLDRRLDRLLGAACNNAYLARALGAMQSQCRRLWYSHRETLNLPRSARLHGALAQAVSDGDRSGAIRAVNEIIAILESLVGGLDTLS